MIRKIQTTFQLVPRCVQLRAQPMEAAARVGGHAKVRPPALLRAAHTRFAVVVTPQAPVLQQPFLRSQGRKLLCKSRQSGGWCLLLSQRVYLSTCVDKCVLGKVLCYTGQELQVEVKGLHYVRDE